MGVGASGSFRCGTMETWRTEEATPTLSRVDRQAIQLEVHFIISKNHSA
jgi:hypothetical protein